MSVTAEARPQEIASFLVGAIQRASIVVASSASNGPVSLGDRV